MHESGSPYAVAIGRRIEQALKESGFETQREMAEAVGCGQATLHRYLRGERQPKAKVMERVAALTDRDILWFLGDPILTQMADAEKRKDLVQSLERLRREMLTVAELLETSCA